MKGIETALRLIEELVNAFETKEDAQDPLHDAADEVLIDEAMRFLQDYGYVQ